MFDAVRYKDRISAHDASGLPLMLDWEKVEGKSPRLTQVIHECSEILADTYTRQEIEFARAHPEAVPGEHFLQPLAPFFRDGTDRVDWSKAEQELHYNFSHLFSATDFAQYASPRDISYFVIARDSYNRLLGLIQFVAIPEYPKGTIKSAYFGLAKEARDRGIERLLMNSIFQIVAGIQRIFMHTRTTNHQLIELCQSWGFTSFKGNLTHWIDLEYAGASQFALLNAVGVQKRNSTLF
jgi:ribosomal protein S18 acetylase RimI-like enzyme